MYTGRGTQLIKTKYYMHFLHNVIKYPEAVNIL